MEVTIYKAPLQDTGAVARPAQPDQAAPVAESAAASEEEETQEARRVVAPIGEVLRYAIYR